jgi:hypothetical protein
MMCVDHATVPEPAALLKPYTSGAFKGKTEAERVEGVCRPCCHWSATGRVQVLLAALQGLRRQEGTRDSAPRRMRLLRVAVRRYPSPWTWSIGAPKGRCTSAYPAGADAVHRERRRAGLVCAAPATRQARRAGHRGRRGLRICYFDPVTGEDFDHADGADERCERRPSGGGQRGRWMTRRLRARRRERAVAVQAAHGRRDHLPRSRIVN